MPGYTRKLLLGCLASRYRTLNQSPLPGKPSDFDTRSHSVIASNIFPIFPTPLGDHVNYEGKSDRRDSVLNLSRDWIVVLTWPFAQPTVPQSSRFRCEE